MIKISELTPKSAPLADTYMSVNEKTFDNINDFLNKLYEQ
jgi:hypothetical protein